MKLSEAIDGYIRYKRSSGVIFGWGVRILQLFRNKVGDIPLDLITVPNVLDFTNAPFKSAHTSRIEWGLLEHFFDYWSVRGKMPFLLLPPPRATERRQVFIPYIYTRFQIRSLLNATKVCQRRAQSLDALTFRTFLLTLYATGARFTEILNLRFEDLMLKQSRITFSGTPSTPYRQLPVSPDLRPVLEAFINERPCKRGRIFLTKMGQPIRRQCLSARFQQLRRIAGIVRKDGAQPRIQDLRPTFAVHRITSWIKNGSDLNRMLPALATYMGYVGLESADRFLSLTPERFRKDLEKLSPQRGRKRWRDDPDLMRFLDNL